MKDVEAVVASVIAARSFRFRDARQRNFSATSAATDVVDVPPLRVGPEPLAGFRAGSSAELIGFLEHLHHGLVDQVVRLGPLVPTDEGPDRASEVDQHARHLEEVVDLYRFHGFLAKGLDEPGQGIHAGPSRRPYEGRLESRPTAGEEARWGSAEC
jgi:hypothetical protein